jgi:hypothetical protein
MNHTPDAAAAANDGGFTPEQAAALLGQTTRQARRQLQPTPPWLLATRGVLVLAVLGAIWLTVRGQHPYRGPTAADIPFAIGFGVLNLTVTLAVANRATVGVAGKTARHPAEITIAVLAFIVPYVVMAPLAAAGVSAGVVYGWYPATVPLIAAGLTWAAISARRARWRECATGLAVAVTGAAGLLAGSAGAWLVAGVGLCAVMLGNAGFVAWQQRS